MIEEKKETIKEFQKSQFVRLVDVFAIAPILIYAGTRKSLHPLLRVSLILIGGATAIYNGNNFVKNLMRNQERIKLKKNKENE